MTIDAETFRNDRQAQLYYTKLDDSDILSSLKVWTDSNDKVLSILSTDIINRNIFKVEIFENPVNDAYAESKKRTIADMFKISLEEAGYLMSIDTIQKDMYDVNEDQITILFKDNTTKDISESSELLNIALLSKKIRKYYLCYQRF